jgi:hypothetical protein
VPKKLTSIEDVPLGKLKAIPEHMDLLRAAIDDIDQRRDLYLGALRSLEKRAGLPLTEQKNAPEVVRLTSRVDRIQYPQEAVKPLTLRAGSWADEIYRLLVEANRPVPPNDLKAAMYKTPLADKMKENGQSFYSTIQRLKQGGHVVEHNGALTTPAIKDKFLEEVAAGRAVEIRHVRYRNPVAEEVYRFLIDKGASATLFEIIEHLKPKSDLPKVREQKAYVLKMLAKLIGQSKSVKRIDRGVYIATEFADAKVATATENERATEGDLLSGARH